MSTKWIDISYHQNVITDAQWKSMKAKKVEGIVIRLGYRGYGSGALKVDERFTYNLNKAKPMASWFLFISSPRPLMYLRELRKRISSLLRLMSEM